MAGVGTQEVHPSQVSEAAKAWGQTIAGVLSAGGIVALLQGGNKISDLETWAQWTLAFLLIGALFCAVTAVLGAFDVAWRYEKQAEGVEHISSDNPHGDGVADLRTSRQLTVLALILLTLTALPLVIGKDDLGTEYFVRFVDNSLVCGELEGTSAALQVAGRDLTDVASISEAPSCPD